MAGGREFASNAVDIGLALIPMTAGIGAGIALGTGKTAGEHITGEQSLVGQTGEQTGVMDIFGGTSRRNAREFQQNKAIEDRARAEEIRAELEAMGRPTMEAQVARQQQISDQARRYAQEGMPEAQRQLAEDNINRTQAQSLSGARSIGSGLRGLANSQATTAQSYRNLNAQDAMMAQANQTQYLQSLSGLGQAEANAEQYNVLQPYAEKQAEMMALMGSADQNQWGVFQQQIAQGQANQQLAMDSLGMATQAGSVAMGASDSRLKENIHHTGYSEDGIPTYTWKYKGKEGIYSGTMAQDLLESYPHAVITMDNGYYAVDYSKIDVDFKEVK